MALDGCSHLATTDPLIIVDYEQPPCEAILTPNGVSFYQNVEGEPQPIGWLEVRKAESDVKDWDSDEWDLWVLEFDYQSGVFPSKFIGYGRAPESYKQLRPEQGVPPPLEIGREYEMYCGTGEGRFRMDSDTAVTNLDATWAGRHSRD